MIRGKQIERRIAVWLVAAILMVAVLITALRSEWLFLGLKDAFANDESLYSFSQSGMSDAERRSDKNIVLTVDSILSVIQGYYVDKSRIDNRNLISLGLGVLSSFPGVRLEHQKSKSIVRYFSKNLVIRNLTNPNYSDVLGWFSRVESFLMASNPNLKPFSFSKNFLLTLDAHSAFLSPDDYLDLKQGTEGVFGGLGVLVGMRNSVLTVIKPIPASPAFKHGISSLDKILSIDGVRTFGANIDRLIEVMRGAPGTEVKMTILRDGALAPEELKIKREVIEVQSVTSRVLPVEKGHVLHMVIDSFSSRTSQEVKQQLKAFKDKYPSAKGLVLDLRSNPGGLLDQAVAVADLFLDSGVIVATKGRREEIEYVTRGEHDTTTPMIVLIDGDSASASEIVAGALQDQNRALIVGQRSFGKGSVQTVFELPGDTAVKITIARYYTPKGRSIQSYGIVPDINLLAVRRTDVNRNLFAFNRYRSEAFLDNHLLNDDDNREIWSKSSFEGLYLAEEKDDFTISKYDEELSLGKFILAKTFEDGVSNLLPVRASNIAARHAEDIAGWLDSKNSEVVAWLEQKFNVNWREGSLKADRIELQASVVGLVVPGRPMTVRYSVRNRSPETSGRISAYVRTEIGTGAESLIGKVDSHTIVSDRIEVNIPGFFSSGIHYVDVGLAMNGNPIESTMMKLPVKVEERGYSFLRTKLSLEDSKNGKIQNSLEAGETGFILLTLSNDSIAKMSEIEVNLENLTGKQALLSEVAYKVNELLPRQTMTLRFPVKGFDTVISKNLEFGVHIDSPDLRSPWDGTFAVTGVPGEKKIEPAQKSLAH